MENKTPEHTNALIKESSTYLLQHAHNPVNWVPWGKEVFERADKEDKLVIISVGYSACHWCHVMEHESFEDKEVAAIMNEHFISVKVDREERPDVDQVYMSAVQIMTGSGGWPMNVVTLPDGRPIYGGTYFRKEDWIKVLENLVQVYKEEPQKVIEYAAKLENGMKQSNMIVKSPVDQLNSEILEDAVAKWKLKFDLKEGGPDHAPKFPLPNNYQFLMRYADQTNDDDLKDYVNLTLRKMAWGGIYDHVGGGFARYSTDMLWKVPHFEKMLYDNAQLISLYSEAYKAYGNVLYKNVVYQTVAWLKREMLDKSGAFYSALDADSEGEEGKFYVWTIKEIDEHLGEDAELARHLYNIGKKGFWEHNNNILLRDEDLATTASKFDITQAELKTRMDRIHAKLLKVRSSRVRPGLDDKTLTSWNAMTVAGLIQAYRVFKEKEFLELADDCLKFILNTQLSDEGNVHHVYKDGKTSVEGFLEDYCFLIEALIERYQVDFEEAYLKQALDITDYTIKHFYDSTSGMFNFNRNNGEELIYNPKEYHDNVIPSSNSVMAVNLFKLGILFDSKEYSDIASQMLANVKDAIPGYASGFSNWAQLYLFKSAAYYQVVITGKEHLKLRKEFEQYYVPNSLLMGAERESNLPLFEGKFADTSRIYVCQDKMCKAPVESAEEAIKQIE